jgi:hypothetical protein
VAITHTYRRKKIDFIFLRPQNDVTQ